MRKLFCLLLIAGLVQAEVSFADSTDDNPMSHGLPAEKLDAIRLIGRNVLQAKNTAKEDASNKEQLIQLTATVDQLIAAETQPLQMTQITVTPKGASSPATQAVTDDTERKAARTQAWGVVTRLRQDAGHLQGQGKNPAQQEVYSAGFPIGDQHGRLFSQWAGTLEATLDTNNTDRVSQLLTLRDQLKHKDAGIAEPSKLSQTPTLQAMPWVEAKNPVTKAQSKNKLKP